MRAVARDLVSAIGTLHHEPLVGGAVDLVALDSVESMRLRMFQEAHQVVVVDVRVPPCLESQGQEQVLPPNVALDHRCEPSRVQSESVLTVTGAATEVHANTFRPEVEVPPTLDRARHVEPDGHVDPLAKVRADLSESMEVLHKLIGQLRSRRGVVVVCLGNLRLAS